MNRIMIPFWKRPELLYLNLEALSKCRNLDNYYLYFKTDKNYDEKCIEIIKNFFGNFDNKEIDITPHPQDLSRNILEGVKKCADKTDNYLVLIEEDIRVTKDFLEYVEYCYENYLSSDVFCIHGFAKDREEREERLNKIERKRWYSPYGVCLPKQSLKLVTPHINERYLSKKGVYVQKLTPGWIHKDKFIEQAGLLQRLRRIHKPNILKPKLSRSQHMGYWGRGAYPNRETSFENRINKIRRVLNSKEKYNKYRKADDFTSFNEDYNWEELDFI